MLLYSKIHKNNSSLRPPQVSPGHFQDQTESEISSDLPTNFAGSKRSSPVERRNTTFSRGFRSFRKTKSVDPAFFKSMAGSSKRDLTTVEDLKRMYPEYDSSNPDHNPSMKFGDSQKIEEPARGRRALSVSKFPNFRRRSLSNLRTPSPRRSFLRETTTNFLDSGAKTLRGWASYLHKQPSPTEMSKDHKKTNLSPVRSSPVPIPSTAPTLAPIEIGPTPFQISENVPMTARPSITPVLGTANLFSKFPNHDNLTPTDTDVSHASAENKNSSFGEPLERMKMGVLDTSTLENPFDDKAASNLPLPMSIEDSKHNCLSTDASCCLPESRNVPQCGTDDKRQASAASNLSVPGVLAEPSLILRRAPAVRRSNSPVRPRTTEEALARFQRDVEASESESPAASTSDNGSDNSLITDWTKRPTHEDIRVRFKGSSQDDKVCKAVFSHNNTSPTAMHPRPLTIRAKQTSSQEEASSGADESKAFHKTSSTSEATSFSSRSPSPTRKFRFANTQRRSTSPETVTLPDIIALDHEVNRLSLGTSDLNTYNRFALLANRQQSEAACKSSQEDSPTANCKCSPCRCNPCKCGEQASPERLHRHILRSELSAISDLSDEERHCAGII